MSYVCLNWPIQTDIYDRDLLISFPVGSSSGTIFGIVVPSSHQLGTSLEVLLNKARCTIQFRPPSIAFKSVAMDVATTGNSNTSTAANRKPRAADSECIASDHAKVPRIPKPKPKPGPRPDAPVQIGPAELGKAFHVLGLAQYRF
jgi:hypothetical protein